MESGAELSRVYVRKTGPHPDLKAKLTLTFKPAMNEEIPIAEWINQTEIELFRLLTAFSKPPEGKIMSLGAAGLLAISDERGL